MRRAAANMRSLEAAMGEGGKREKRLSFTGSALERVVGRELLAV